MDTKQVKAIQFSDISVSRKNKFIFTRYGNVINTDFIIKFLEHTSFSIIKPTVILLDNAHDALKQSLGLTQLELKCSIHK